MAVKRKRKMSAAQKAALAKGRKKLAASRKPKRKPVARKAVARKRVARKPAAKKQIIFMEGSPMTTRRKRRVTRRKPIARKRRRVSVYMGQRKPKLPELLMDTAISTGSAIAGSAALAQLPIPDARLKAAMPLLAGIGLSVMANGMRNRKQARLVNNAANGLLIAGGLAITKQLAPGLSLAGEIPYAVRRAVSDNSAMGFRTDLMGIPTDLYDASNNDDMFR